MDYADFPNARTGSPLVLEVTEEARDIYRQEIFGPVSFVIKGDTIDDCLHDATINAREKGAITSHVYSVNEEFLHKAVDAYHAAGASVACNLVGMPHPTANAPTVCKWGIWADPHAPKGLDCAISDGSQYIGSDDLDHGNFLCCALGADRVHHPGSVQNQEPSLVNFNSGFGNPLRDHTVLM